MRWARRSTRCSPVRLPQHLAARIDGVLVAPMVRGGVETILGIHMDPVFGPMVMFGLGGTAVELYKDVAFASAPLDPRARAGAGATRCAAPLCCGAGAAARSTTWRRWCRPCADCRSLRVAHAGQLAGVDINPFVVQTSGGVCLDALISTRASA
jgi:hypothetical protein